MPLKCNSMVFDSALLTDKIIVQKKKLCFTAGNLYLTWFLNIIILLKTAHLPPVSFARLRSDRRKITVVRGQQCLRASRRRRRSGLLLLFSAPPRFVLQVCGTHGKAGS